MVLVAPLGYGGGAVACGALVRPAGGAGGVGNFDPRAKTLGGDGVAGGGRAGTGGGVGLGAVSVVGADVVGVGGGSAVSQGAAAEGNGCSAGATGVEGMSGRSESLTVGAVPRGWTFPLEA